MQAGFEEIRLGLGMGNVTERVLHSTSLLMFIGRPQRTATYHR